jgi:uncharacterized protein YdbL (DUF1318 family)
MAGRFTTAWLAFVLIAALATAAGASGLDLERAKDQGLVGERVDGYVGIVAAQADAPVQALVNSVNAKRRAAYEEIAQKNGTSVDAVAVLAGAKLIERAAKGAWVTDADGVWRKK